MTEIDTSTESIARLMDGVTPGPWAYAFTTASGIRISGNRVITGGEEYPSGNSPKIPNDHHWDGGDSIIVPEMTHRDNNANARFIAASRELVPALAAERDALRAEVERLRHQINEASDPAFIWGALDNVHDCDTTLDDYADAVSRAIRSALK